MTTIYLTGDRSVEPLSAVNVTAAVLQLIVEREGPNVKIITGDAITGIERAVRYLLPLGAVLTVAERKPKSATNEKPDFDEFHTRIKPLVDAVYIVHGDPLVSSIAKSAMRVFPGDIIRFPLTESSITPDQNG